MSDSKYDISLVIPAYNEEKRVDLLVEGIKSFSQKTSYSFEAIIVDDGSTDSTIELLENHPDLAAHISSGSVKIVRQNRNQGKGEALKTGVKEAQGNHILTLDADMATSPLEIENWKKRMGKSFSENEIWIGSRPHNDSDLEEKPIRKFIGAIYNFIIRFLTGLPHLDTQCGFKLYPKEIGKYLFASLKTKGWAHDVEILKRASYLGIPVIGLPVLWRSVDESKVNLVSDSFKMFFQTLRIVLLTGGFWLIAVPLKNLNGKSPFGFITTAKFPDYKQFRVEGIFRFAFFILFIIVLIAMPMLSFDFGMSGDEWIQNEYGKEIYAFFAEGDESVLNPQGRRQFYDTILYYTGGFELLCVWLYKTLGIENEYALRHVVNSLFGVMAFLFTGLLAREASGSWRTAFIAFVLILFTPRVFGHSMNNPKDIPFAAGIVFSLYYLLKFVKALPNPRVRDMIFLALGIGLTLNVRIGGIILIAYAGLFSLLQVADLYRQKLIDLGKSLPKLITYGAAIALGGYILGIMFWPFGLQDPINNPFEALNKMTNFPVTVSVLFEGEAPQSNNLPWYYALKWILISNPILPLLGLAGFVLLLVPIIKRVGWVTVFILVFAAAFPPAYTIYKKSVIYDGWRHFIWIWPSMVVMSALFWDQIMFQLKAKGARVGGIIAFVILLALPARWMVMAHPNQYVYFNEVFGGLPKAYGEYETDYYMNSVKQAVDWLVENENLASNPDTLRILSNCSKEVKQYLIAKGLHHRAVYSKYERRIEKHWNYGIFISRFTDASLLVSSWPQENLNIHNIEESGVILSAILKKENSKDVDGFKALKAGNPGQALSSLDSYLATDKQNELVWIYRGDAQAGLGQVDEALKSYNEGLKIHPGSVTALTKMGQIFTQQNNFAQALKAYQRMIQYHPQMFQGYYYAGIVSLNSGNSTQGIAYLKRSIEVEPRFKQGYQVLAQVYQQQGNNQLAKQYQDMAAQLPN